MSKHDDWLRAAEEACSYRRMYALALEISIETIDPSVKAAADAVVDVLKDVIELALASSDTLKEGRRRFTTMVNALIVAPELEHYRLLDGSASKQVESLLCRILEEVASRTGHELPAIRIMKSDMKLARKASQRGR